MSQGLTGHATIVIAVDDNGVGRQVTSQSSAAAREVLAAVWCRSVGTSWTLELYELDGDRTLGRIREWINFGGPIWQPAPDRLAAELLAERGLRLVLDPDVGPRMRSRRGIGYACPDAGSISRAYRARRDLVPDPARRDRPVRRDS